MDLIANMIHSNKLILISNYLKNYIYLNQSEDQINQSFPKAY